MDSLRLILLLIGIAVILAVYLHNRFKKMSDNHFSSNDSTSDSSAYSNPDYIDSNAASDSTRALGDTNDIQHENHRKVIVDPSVYSFEDKQVRHNNMPDDELSELGHQMKINDRDPVARKPNTDIRPTGDECRLLEPENIQAGKQESKQEGGLIEKAMVIYLLAQPEQKFSGNNIIRVAKSEGLTFGIDSYFHCYENPNDKSSSIFGIANIQEPGLFDLSDSENFSTPGLVFFQQLSNSGNALAAFDEMLQSVIQFRDELDGRLQDSGRHPLNRSAMIKLREQVLNFSQEKPVSSL